MWRLASPVGSTLLVSLLVALETGCMESKPVTQLPYFSLHMQPVSSLLVNMTDMDRIPGEPPLLEPSDETTRKILAVCNAPATYDPNGPSHAPGVTAKGVPLELARPIKVTAIMKTPLYPVFWNVIWFNSERSGAGRPTKFDVIESPAGIFSEGSFGGLYQVPAGDSPMALPAGWSLEAARRVAQAYFPASVLSTPLLMERVLFPDNLHRPREFYWRLKDSDAPYFVGADGIAYHAVSGYELDGGRRLIHDSTVYLERLTPVDGSEDWLDLPRLPSPSPSDPQT